jgi:hypothetical protein
LLDRYYKGEFGADGKPIRMWEFFLADIDIFGTTTARHVPRKNLAMDYNFFFVQTNGVDQVQKLKNEGNSGAADALEKQLENQMYYSYVNYFFSNYAGNRAPVNIGHHFSQWNGGAYWKAMKRFARLVCGLPEVKCSTYSELVSFMDANQSKVAQYQAGNFDRVSIDYKKIMHQFAGRAGALHPLENQTDDDYNPNNKLMNDPADAHEGDHE